MVKKSLIKGQFTNLSRLGKVTWDDDLFPLGKVKEGRLNITRLDRQGKKTLPELRKGSSYSCHCDSLKGPPDRGSIPESRVRSPLLMLPGRKKPGCLKKKKKKIPRFLPSNHLSTSPFHWEHPGARRRGRPSWYTEMSSPRTERREKMEKRFDDKSYSLLTVAISWNLLYLSMIRSISHCISHCILFLCFIVLCFFDCLPVCIPIWYHFFRLISHYHHELLKHEMQTFLKGFLKYFKFVIWASLERNSL